MMWRAQLPLGKKTGLEPKGTGSPAAPGKGVESEIPGTLRRPEVPTSHSCSLLYFLKPWDLCFGKQLPREET